MFSSLKPAAKSHAAREDEAAVTAVTAATVAAAASTVAAAATVADVDVDVAGNGDIASQECKEAVLTTTTATTAIATATAPITSLEPNAGTAGETAEARTDRSS